MDINIEAELNGEKTKIDIWIKSAKNEGISVHVPSKHNLTTEIRSKREISAYIPGLAGIPLSEEKRSKRIIHRQAAAGDANTVLRNLLDQLNQRKDERGISDLQKVSSLVSKVLGDITLKISFNEESDYKIQASFQTKSMKATDSRMFKPLELAGIGFLQVIQIFSYLVYFKPRLLLVDEPDSHLHPDIQEKLALALLEAATTFDCQVILTTHSPSVVRGLTHDASMIWMKEGQVASHKTDEIRADMGWGLLDKSILLVTEDKLSGMLRKLISQWPEIERKVAIWPTKGSSGLPPAESMAGLSQLFGKKMKIVLHRDSDFMTMEERKHFAAPYKSKSIDIWITEGSDIESYWIRPDIISETFNINEESAAKLIEDACDFLDSRKANETFRKKRMDILNKLPCYKGEAPELDQIGTADAKKELQEKGRHNAYIGKDLISAIRELAEKSKLKGGHSLARTLPQNTNILLAPDLEIILKNLK